VTFDVIVNTNPGGAVTIQEQFEFEGYSSGKFGDIIS